MLQHRLAPLFNSKKYFSVDRESEMISMFDIKRLCTKKSYIEIASNSGTGRPIVDSKIIEKLITDENTLINYRLTWVSAFNGLMFAGISFSQNTFHYNRLLISSVGLAINISILISLCLSECSRITLCNKLSEIDAGLHYLTCKSLLAFPCNIILPWFVLPVVFIVFWLLGLFGYLRPSSFIYMPISF